MREGLRDASPSGIEDADRRESDHSPGCRRGFFVLATLSCEFAFDEIAKVAGRDQRLATGLDLTKLARVDEIVDVALAALDGTGRTGDAVRQLVGSELHCSAPFA